MELREYLFRNRMTMTSFCNIIHCSRSYMSLVIHKKKIPGKRLAKDIEHATEGLVTATELLTGEYHV